MALSTSFLQPLDNRMFITSSSCSEAPDGESSSSSEG